MNEIQTANNPEINTTEESSIDWMELVAKLWKNKKFIILWTFIFMILGVVAALRSTRQYATQVTLAPEMSTSKGSLSSFRGIMGAMGLGGGLGSLAGDGTEALNFTLFPEMVSSTPFITELFDMKVKPYVSPKDLEKGKPDKPETTLYRFLLKKDEPKGFVAQIMDAIFGEKKDSVVTVNPKHLTREQEIAVNMLRKSISADVDKKSGITTISVIMTDPVMAAQLADTVCVRLQRKIFEYRTQKAAADLNYYAKLSDEAKEKMIKAQAAYAVSVDFDRSVILKSVSSEKERLQQEASFAVQLYQQMEQQKELAKAKYQEAKPVFAVVQPATVPLTPVSGRAKIVLIFMFLGFVGSAAWRLYGADYLKKFLSGVNEKMAQEKKLESKVDTK